MENPRKIRNFVIIAHIDSGKSTLADRFLESTHTVEMRNMRPQYLDRHPLERERGITIKLAPVRMTYQPTTNNEKATAENNKLSNSEYILNLIDTPGHSDFSYEVSRALEAVEGAVLLIDATKGIQAQTLSNLRAARKAGLKIIGAVNKIDLQLPHLPKIISSVAELLGEKEENIFLLSAKTGKGVSEILEVIANVVPPPKTPESTYEGIRRCLIFDSLYDDHKGIIAFVRVFNGAFKSGDEVRLAATGATFKIKELGYFSPDFKSAEAISQGEIGYIATGLKEPALIKIGDTVLGARSAGEFPDSKKWALPGYREAAPVVFISFYPDGTTKFDDVLKAFGRLRLNDAALSFEPDANEALGRGLKVGFLGQLHFEITASRLTREFNLEFITSFPSIAYRVKDKKGERIIKQPQDFPDAPEKVWQPMIQLEILTPQQYVGQVMNLKNIFDLEIGEVENMGENLVLSGQMPLAELIRDFDDQLKSASAGFASFSYELKGEAEAEAEKLEILIAEEIMPELTRIVAKKDVEHEARSTVGRLKELLPKQQFPQAIQARVHGRIIARETVPAMKKLLGSFGKTGGDRTRKMKLWKKQKRGKEKLKEMGSVKLSPEIFRNILKK